MRPPWKNILMIAIMARRPLSNTVFNFAVIQPMPFRCVKVKPEYSMRPHKATIWSQLANGTSEKTIKVFGLRRP